MSFELNDTTYKTPITASFVDDSAMNGNKGSGIGNILAIVAEANNLPPLTPVKLANYRAARAAFGDDEPVLLKAIEKAFNPSKDAGVSSPDFIYFVNPRADTQASLILVDTAASPSNAINLSAKKSGKYGANISVTITNGTLGANTRKLTLTNGALPPVVKDNIRLDLFSMSYSGSEATATVQSVLTGDIQYLRVTIGVTVTNLSFDVYASIGGLVDALNQLPDVTATLTNPAARLRPTPEIDAFPTATSFQASAVTVRSLLASVIRNLNAMTGWVTATRIAGLKMAPATRAKTFLSYTETTAATLSQWQAAFDALKDVKCHWLVPLTSNTDVHGMASAHVNYMSDVAFQERRAVIGIASGSTNADALAVAETIDNPRVSVVHTGFYDHNIHKAMTLYPPIALAALIAGMMCGVTPGTALTNKTINVSDVAVRLRNPEDTDDLLPGGVLCCWRDYNGDVRVLQSVTTSQQADNFNRHEMSVGAASDFIAQALRDAVSPLRGQKNTPYLPGQLKAACESRLEQLAKPEPLGDGVIVGDADNPAWTGLTVVQSIDSNTISVQVSPVIPNNYIGINIYETPYTGTTA